MSRARLRLSNAPRSLVALTGCLLLVAAFGGIQAGASVGAVAGFDQVYHPGELLEDGEVAPSTDIPLCSPEITTDCYAGQPLRVQAAYVGGDAAEPTMGVDDEGVAFMAAYDGVTRVMRSTDGGVTWASVEPRIPGTDVPRHPTSLDPYLYVDEETGRVFWLDWHGDCSFITWSDDQGAS